MQIATATISFMLLQHAAASTMVRIAAFMPQGHACHLTHAIMLMEGYPSAETEVNDGK